MRTFAQKPKAALQVVPARARPGKSPEVRSILHPNQAVQRSAQTDQDRKAELEFHSTISFHTRSGSSSIGPTKEGFTFLEMHWTVLNSGWVTAPEHEDRVTIYKADRCSGCRDDKDDIFSTVVTAPATEPGKKYEAVTALFGMTLRAGHYDAYVDLDIHDEVDEINKDNNTIFTSWYTAPNPEPEEE